MRVAAYVRVSTIEQASEGYGLLAQRQAITDYCRAEGHEVVEWCEDGGVNGDLPLAERPGLLAALEAVRLRQGDPLPIGAVVCARFDRLSRDTLEALLAEREFGRLDARLLCAQGLNEDDPQTKFFRTVMLGMAELDKAMLLSRLANGRAAKASQGGYAGGRPPIGFKAEGKALVPLPIDSPEVKAVRAIFKLAGQGTPAGRIAEEFTERGVLGRRWHKKSVLAVLHREAYKRGDSPLVDPRIWNRANRALNERNRHAVAA